MCTAGTVVPSDPAGGSFDEPVGAAVGPCGLHPAFRRAGDTGVLELDGELDIATAPILIAALDAAAATVPGVSLIVVDLDGLTFCGARGLELLMDAAETVARRGGLLVLARRPALVLRLMDMLGIACRSHPLAVDRTAVALLRRESAAAPDRGLR